MSGVAQVIEGSRGGPLAGADALAPGASVVELAGITRSFGAVRALRGVDLVIAPGECVGLVGHNGAGKSTLVNVLAGLIDADGGTYRILGRPADSGGGPGRGAARPSSSGVVCVSQEIVLAPNLTVAENARLTHRELTGPGWRRRAARLMGDALDEIFPGHGIDSDAAVGDLSISRRQMVEIARAFAARNARLMILDEPTSSLDGGASEQLLAHVARRRAEGLAVVLITHLLGEVLSAATRAVVMRDGVVVMNRPAAGLSRADLVEAMGHVAGPAPAAAPAASGGGRPAVAVPASGQDTVAVRADSGEVIGLAGLAGRGQTAFLHALMAGHGVVAGLRRDAVAFVAGDRKTDGVFPAWSVRQNVTVQALGAVSRGGLIDPGRERRLAEEWRERIGIRTASVDADLLTLSGGNQQKVLFARALASPARIILMDDPMRGVDIGTKTEVYRLIRREAASGRCFVWYTTEFDELAHCDRAYVFRDGAAAAVLAGDEITERNVVEASFGA